MAALADVVRIGREVARVFGWKRFVLLVAGLVVVVAGVIMVARPQIVLRMVEWERLTTMDGVARAGEAMIAAGGLTVWGLAIRAEELRFGARLVASGLAIRADVGGQVPGPIGITVGAVLLTRPRILSASPARDGGTATSTGCIPATRDAYRRPPTPRGARCGIGESHATV